MRIAALCVCVCACTFVKLHRLLLPLGIHVHTQRAPRPTVPSEPLMVDHHANQILAALHIECQNESSRPVTLSPINTQHRPSSTEPPSHSEVDPAHTRKGSSTHHSAHPHLRNLCAITHRSFLGPHFTTTRASSVRTSVRFTRKHLHRTHRSHPPTPSTNVHMQPRRSLHSPARDAHSNHRTRHVEDTTTFTCPARR